MSVKIIDELEVYNRAEKFSDDTWFEVATWKDYFAKDTIGKQIVSSADSISANIAEGFGRFHYKENKNFCYFSRGSIIETKAWLKKCRTRNLIDSIKADNFLDELSQIHKMLNSYIKFIGSKSNDQ